MQFLNDKKHFNSLKCLIFLVEKNLKEIAFVNDARPTKGNVQIEVDECKWQILKKNLHLLIKRIIIVPFILNSI